LRRIAINIKSSHMKSAGNGNGRRRALPVLCIFFGRSIPGDGHYEAPQAGDADDDPQSYMKKRGVHSVAIIPVRPANF
jgi:hypothetical protein